MKKEIFAVSSAAIFVVAVGACSSTPASNQPNANNVQQSQQDQTLNAFNNQQSAVPYPADQLTNSLERQNLRNRLLITNKPDLLGYVYLLSFGKPIGYYTINGKVSSTQSQMTSSQLVLDKSGGTGNVPDHPVVEAPGDDGSYGANEHGEFFFTTEGAFVETSLDYLYSSQPLPVNVPKLNSQ